MFWHSCPRHGAKQLKGPSAELWAAKMLRNREQDAENDAALDRAGWQVLRFWECAVRKDAEAAATLVVSVTRPRLRKGPES